VDNQVKAGDFVSRKRTSVSREEFSRILENFKKEDVDTMKDINNPIYEWKCIYAQDSDEKYGRIMVSYNMKVWRRQTMGEFYGSSTVD
jgi:hypothetical protein